MKTPLSIGGIVAILCLVTCHSFRRDYSFDQQAGIWVKFHPMPMKWEDAALRCFYEGAILATPLNEQIRNTLIAIMDKHRLMRGPMFTGISNVHARTEYQSIEGVPLTDIDLRWSDAPAVDDSQANCLLMYSDGTFSAVPTSDRHPFVCYKEKGAQHLGIICGTSDPGYEFDNRTGSCYKIYKEQQSWPEAFESCAVDGAHLAVINSETEAKVLYELSINLPTNGRDDFVLIGFRAWGPKRAWITVQGQSLHDAGYAKWYNGEPDNTDFEACGAITLMDFQAGILKQISCNPYPRHYFICEIDNGQNM